MSTPGPSGGPKGGSPPSQPLPHLALLGAGGAPAEGAALQLLGVAPAAGRQLPEAAALQEAHLLRAPPLLQDLLLGLELGAHAARGGAWGAGPGGTCRDREWGSSGFGRLPRSPPPRSLQTAALPPHPLCSLLWPQPLAHSRCLIKLTESTMVVNSMGLHAITARVQIPAGLLDLGEVT